MISYRLISRTKTTNANGNAKNTNGKKLTSLDQYSAEKEAAKQHRINLYNAKISRKEGLKTRQDQEKKNHKKKQFRTWFDAMASNQAYLDREARRQGKQWKIKVAAMVERLPVVTPDRPQWELDFLNLKAELGRYDGIAYPKELGFPDPIDDRVLSEQELMDLLPEGFTPAPRETEADKSGDIQTLNRQLKTRVYLSIRNNDAQGWHLPTASLKEDETFLDGAKRATEHVAGDELILRCFSNCPMGIDVVEYSDEEKENNGGFFGEKIFYMRVQHEDGDVKTSKVSKMEDWGWLAREEMVEKVTAEKRDEAALFYKYML